MTTRSKWLDWKPSNQESSILEKTARDEPAKTTKTVFDVFVGAPMGTSQKIEVGSVRGDSATSVGCKAGIATEFMPEPSPEEMAHASSVLTKAGIRFMRIDGVDMVGVWSDLDRPEVRAALRTYGSHELPVRYLDGDVPMHFKLRKAPGEPVPANVLAATEQEPNQPWVVRDRLLVEMGWTSDGIPWAEWKAASLNRLFLEQGVTGKPGKIGAATVLDGERKGN